MVTAILTTNITYADFIVANVVGSIYGLPVYTVHQDPISINQTVSYLLQNNVTNVIIIGGPAVISTLLFDELNKTYISYKWIWGVRRYDTSAYVAMLFWNNSNYAVILTRDLVNENVKGKKIKLVTEAVQLAQNYSAPILIVPDGSLWNSTIRALTTLQVKEVFIFTGEEGSLGRIPDELRSLGINYTVYTLNDTHKIENMVCKYLPKVIYVNISEDTDWFEIREVFVGKIGEKCILPQVQNGTVAIPFEKQKIKAEIEVEFKEKRKNEIKIEEVIESKAIRLLEVEQDVLERIRDLCARGRGMLICAQVNKSIDIINQTYSKILSGNFTDVNDIIELSNELEYEIWKINSRRK
ncbi:MAG: cell wall-binding repeat-containing protein [Nanopusillaceae archaeon]